MPAVRALAIGLVVLCVAAARGETHEAKGEAPSHPIYSPAFTAAEKGNWKKARELAAKGEEPLVNKVIGWLALTEAQPLPPFADIAAFIDDNPDWPRFNRLRRRAEAAIDDRVSDAEVFAWFARHPPLTGLGKLRLAEAKLRDGDEAGATALLREAWVEGDFTAREERAFLKRHRKRLRLEDHVARLDRLIWDRRRRAAERMLRRVDAGHRALGVARIRLMMRAGGVDAAIARVPESLRNDSGLWYERLRWRRRKGRDQDARAILAAPPAALVRPEAWWREAHILVRRALGDGLISEGYRLASEHRQDGRLPRAQGEWLAGWIALRFLRDPELAYPHFTAMHAGVRYPISLARAAYWAGRAAEALGHAEDAENWYRKAAEHPVAYYGQLARARLGGDAGLSLPDEPAVDEDDIAFVESDGMTRVANALARVGQERHLRPFIMHLAARAKTPGRYQMVAVVARAANRPDLAIAVARRAAREGIILVEQGFPVVALPASRGKDPAAEPALLLAMLRQESGFYNEAVSHAGARGMMQLMPGTARVVARRLKLPYSRKRLTNDADYNLTLGRAYIEDLLEKFDGSYVLALAAYNAGTRRATRWIKQYGDPRAGEIDPIDWVELIPLSETRNYVQRVLEALAVYRLRLGETLPPEGLAGDLQRGMATPPNLAESDQPAKAPQTL
ncbi:MAG: lytic transglycosylase domain-containing protein [Alphaproteobacteria bacterium]